MTTSPPPAPPAAPPPAAHAPSLRHLGPGHFTIVMGLAGLALALRRAEPVMGEAAGWAANALALLAALVFVALAVAALLRARRHPNAWAEDLRHPVRHAFVAAIPIGAILLATLGNAAFGPHAAVRALWMLGCAAQALVTVWVLARFLRGPAPGWAGVTPALIVPIVGNVLAPLAGPSLGFEAWAAAQFGLGLLLWPVVLALLLVRLVVQGPWPERLTATAFITIAPPAVAGLSALQLGAPALVGWLAWGAAAGFALVAATALPRLRTQPFALPWWAMSFPLAAFAALTLRLGAHGLGLVLLALAAAVVFGLVLATARAWRDGSLWAPEPVAAIQPVSATSTAAT